MALDDFLKIVFGQIRERDKIRSAESSSANRHRAARAKRALPGSWRMKQNTALRHAFDLSNTAPSNSDAPIFAPRFAEEVDLPTSPLVSTYATVISSAYYRQSSTTQVAVDGKNTTARRKPASWNGEPSATLMTSAAAFRSAPGYSCI